MELEERRERGGKGKEKTGQGGKGGRGRDREERDGKERKKKSNHRFSSVTRTQHFFTICTLPMNFSSYIQPDTFRWHIWEKERIKYLHRVFMRIKVDHTWKILPTVLVTW